MEKLKNLVGIVVGLLTIKELAARDQHVQSLMTWLAGLSASPYVASHDLHWAGFVVGFTGASATAWYTWLLATTVASFVFFLGVVVLNAVQTWVDLADTFLIAALAIGLAICLVGAKASWLLLAHGTILSIAGGVVLALVVVWGLVLVLDEML